MKPVRVVSETSVAKLIVDPTKRQILRHLAEKDLTQKQLAEELGIAPSSVSYHVRDLRGAGLIRAVREEPEAHGILQKFYRATALYFIVDYAAVPLDLRRYFLAVSLERLRGIFSVLKAVKDIDVPLSSKEMERVADRIAFSLATVARRYEDSPFEGERESLIVLLYAEALRDALEKDPSVMAPLTSLLANLRLAPASPGT